MSQLSELPHGQWSVKVISVDQGTSKSGNDFYKLNAFIEPADENAEFVKDYLCQGLDKRYGPKITKEHHITKGTVFVMERSFEELLEVDPKKPFTITSGINEVSLEKTNTRATLFCNSIVQE